MLFPHAFVTSSAVILSLTGIMYLEYATFVWFLNIMYGIMSLHKEHTL